MRIRTDWRQRLAALVEGKQWAPTSRAAKLNSTYLRDILERNQTPQLKSAEKLSASLGVPMTDWFLEGDRNPAGAHDVASIQPAQMPRDVPVRGAAACGTDGAFEFNSGDPIDYIRRPPRLENVRDVYALYILGASMSPWREEGQIVYVHPLQPPKIGDYVVLQLLPLRDGEAPRAYVKKLEKRNSLEITVSQYNPAKRLTFPVNRIVSVHRIMDWSELLGV